MKTLVRIVAVAMLLLAFAGCRKGPKIIPQKDFGNLYAELLLADQWVKLHPAQKRIADTTLVYAEILRSHGYTDEQVVASMKYYLRDPLRYKRAMDVAVAKLESHFNEVEAELAIQRNIKNFLKEYHPKDQKDTLWRQRVGRTEPLDSTVRRVADDSLFWAVRDSLYPFRPAVLFEPSHPYPSVSL